MNLLAINWSGVGLQLGYLLFSLSILVIIHEFGHYITAKWFKCRVEKFYLFFDPWFSIFKKKVGETEYGIGWLPLGGYVKIAGMVDESMDKEQLAKPPQPWEFRSKPAWQRLIIMLAGVTMNVLLAFVIYAMILYTWGETKLPMKNVTYGIVVTDSILQKAGLEDGDKVLTVNGEAVEYFDQLPAKILLGQQITVERDGQKKTLTIPPNFIEQLVEQKGKKRNTLVAVRMPIIIGGFVETGFSGPKEAGLKVYDRIVGIDSVPLQYFDQIAPVLNRYKGGDTVSLSIERDGVLLQKKVKLDSLGNIGFYQINGHQADSLGILKLVTRNYGFLASFPAGVMKTGEQLDFYVQQIKLIFNPETGAYKGLGGFKTMASIFPSTEWNWEAFWKITAFFSIILAFMNLLPIPALDGGHVVFTLVEMATGRKPSDKFLEYAQIVGMIILFGLLIFANLNDWIGWGSN